jgi:hypothetical protein
LTAIAFLKDSDKHKLCIHRIYSSFAKGKIHKSLRMQQELGSARNDEKECYAHE